MKKATAVGEILWESPPGGKRPGGAPANLARHRRAPGLDARLVSRIGDDDLGREIPARFKAPFVHARSEGTPELPDALIRGL